MIFAIILNRAFVEKVMSFLMISSIGVVNYYNPIFSLIFLVFSFMSAAFLLFFLECELLAFLFIIVYVGAVMILFLFVIMMLPSKPINQQENSLLQNSPQKLFWNFFLFIVIVKYYYYQFTKEKTHIEESYENKYQNWYDLTDSINDVELYGKILYSYFVVEILILGLILLLVLIGVVHLTKNRNAVKQMRSQSNSKQLARRSKFSG